MGELVSKPFVSVVLPVYNAENFLRDSLDSILHQTYTHFELIIVNDGSTDGSKRIIESYSDPRIKYIEQSNCGVAVTLNNAISLCRGEYIWRHDADDISLPEKLYQQVEFLTSHPEFDLCSTQIAFMTERGFVADKFRQPADRFFNHKEFIEIKREHFNPYSPITHATVLIRTKVLMALNGYRTAFKTAEDVDLWLRFLQQYRAAVLNSCNYYVRLNKASATAKYGNQNEVFRNLAFKYYEQRLVDGKDDIEKGIPVIIPKSENKELFYGLKRGGILRTDLLNFQYPLHISAGDWKESLRIFQIAIKDGWRLSQTWKSLIFPVFGGKLVRKIVSAKKFIKHQITL